jgi:heat shock protein HslJ
MTAAPIKTVQRFRFSASLGFTIFTPVEGRQAVIIIRYIITLAVLAGCSVENDERSPNDPAANGSTTNNSAQAVALTGTWLITAFDEAPPVLVEDRPPSLTFTRGGYGGTAGCNALGGIGTLQGDRYFSFPGPQTQMGCSDPVGEHEAILHTVMLGSPRTSQGEDGRLVLQAKGHRLVLRRDEHTPDAPNQPAPSLDLMQFHIDTINGTANTWVASKGLSLEFDGPHWHLKTVCGTSIGIWKQRDWLLEISQTGDTVSPCGSEDQEIAKTVGAVLASRPSFALGANGEFVMAGGGNWMVGYGKSLER